MPLTSHHEAEYDQVLIEAPEGGLSNNSVTLPDQMRAIDRERLVRRLGKLKPATMREIDRSMKIVLSLS